MGSKSPISKKDGSICSPSRTCRILSLISAQDDILPLRFLGRNSNGCFAGLLNKSSLFGSHGRH